ncbi:MAG: SCP2 sterol-binding domain-containing protein [Gammaproteobacteria bacterium]|nr:SCP2 sterol-binding domain-containing protein [Gammaproteobacteria bacterium]
MSTLLSTIATWSVSLTNSLISLDAATRARLAKLEGRRIRIETIAPDDAITLHFTRGAIAVDDSAGAMPSVIVRGATQSLVQAFLRGDSSDAALEIDGDELLLADFVSVLRGSAPI